MGQFILYSLLFSTFAEAVGPLSSSNMRGLGCHDLQRRICKSPATGYCEAVYIASPTASDECKSRSSINIKKVCGDENAQLFQNDTECIAPKAHDACPASLSNIKQSDLQELYRCPDLYSDLCNKVCGVRYDIIEVRNFFQTNRKPGIVCLDASIEREKNGITLDQDLSRKTCLETHLGIMRWCISYQKKLGDVELGAFVQCAGRIP